MTESTDEKIKSFLDTCLKGRGFEIVRLAGDASTRVYYRVAVQGGSKRGRQTLVLMHMAEPDPDPLFIGVQQVLHSAGVPVPAIHGFDPGLGLMLLDDFGDITLEQAVSGADEQHWLALYLKSVQIMADIQFKGMAQRGECPHPCFSLAFDTDKLMYEMDFFVEHVLRIWKEAEFKPGEERALRGELEALCAELAAEPRVLCHRDYHSRNLMVLEDGELGVIDFQDARMGPCQYDLVSLLHDSYVDMPQTVREQVYDAYVQRLEIELPGGLDKDHFYNIYLLMVLQRNLKAAGSFAYLDCVKNMNRYLARMPQCLGHVRAAFERLPAKARLMELLESYLPELGRTG
jgi:hypothetical protein